MNEAQKKQVHIVLDLETMGTAQDAAIIEIGMVIFNHMGYEGTIKLLQYYSHTVDLESSMYNGGTLTADTLMWWMHSDRTVARHVWLASSKLPITTALDEVAYIIRNWSVLEPKPLIWGNGVNFDNAILKSAYERLGLIVPWNYWQEADFRTLKLLYKDLVPKPAFLGTPHKAIDDARHEASWLSLILKYIYATEGVRGMNSTITTIDELLSKD